MMLVLVATLSGCGSGIVGGDIAGLPTSAVALDAGQSYTFSVKVDGAPTVSWALSGAGCAGVTCGTLSSATGGSVVYTAPAEVAKAQSVALNAVVSGASANVSSKATISLSPHPLLTGVALPATVAGGIYNAALTVAGGTAPFQWSLASGSLPAGLALDAVSGTLSGSPKQSGSFSFAVQVTDGSAARTPVQATYSVSVAPAPLLVAAALPDATVGVTYSSTVAVTGGVGPYNCSVAGGALPAGLATNGCTVTGTPIAASDGAVTIHVTDEGLADASALGTVKIKVAPQDLRFVSTTLPSATVGLSYNASIAVAGGVAPYACSLAGGSLPAGLTLNNCSVAGRFLSGSAGLFSVRVSDASSPARSVSGSLHIALSSAPLQLLTSALSAGTVAVPYSDRLAVLGGAAPFTCSISAGALPAGLSLNACVVSGVPTAAGSGSVSLSVTDSGSPASTISNNAQWTIAPAAPGALSLVTSTLPAGVVGTAYSGQLVVTGGTAPYACSLAQGALPAGLSLNGCVVAGTPSAEGTASVMVRAVDASSPAMSTVGSVHVTIAASPAAPLTLASTMLPNGAVGASYSGTISVRGGTAPYTCRVAGGALPSGVTLSGCAFAGTPTTAGAGSVSLQASDSSSPALSVNGTLTWNVAAAPLALTTTTLPGGVIGTSYTGAVAATGGTAPYACSVAAGTLPAGTALNGCSITGSPVKAETGSVTIRVTDAGSPAMSVTGGLGYTIAPGKLTLTKASLPNGTAGVFYKSGFAIGGGVEPYTCSVPNGGLPAGLKLIHCTVLGTPSAAAASVVTVEVRDAAEPASVVSGSVNLAIAPAVLTLGDAVLPNAVDGQPYAGALSASGGTAPYQYSVVGGTLPAGLALRADGTVTGVATSTGSASFTAKVTDASSPQASATHVFVVTAGPAALTLQTAALPAATAGQAYSAAMKITGGTAPYSCSLLSGSLPNGLALSGCSIAGTATTAGSVSVTTRVMDASTPVQNASGTVTLTVSAPALTIATTTLPTGSVAMPYSAVLHVTGGVGADSCTVTSGSLPTGLQLNAATCSIAGTPTVAGTSTLAVTVSDANAPVADVATATLQLSVSAGAMSVTTASLSNPVLGQAYTQTVQVTGGQAPYTFAVTSGALPRGLSLAANGAVSGTPTAAGASGFTVTVTDSAITPQTASQQFAPLVVYAAGANNAQLSGSYAFLVQGYDAAQGSDVPYQTASAGSFVADGNGLVTSGEMDANHQSATTGTAAAVPQRLIGTYVVGADDRGLVTLTTVERDGSTGATTTYEIAAAGEAPANGSASPVDVAANGGSPMQAAGAPGLLLLQDTTSFGHGLTGSYAFGLRGDTPCLITCVVGITGGAVAEVGEFTTNGAGAITGGVADSNIGAAPNASAALSGSYGSADAGGRLQMTLTTSNTPAGIYPTNYAVYLVNATEALLLSTDSHGSHILLSGTAELQTQSSFSNAAMSGAVVGYENATVDPLALGVGLATVDSAPIAMLFRATATADGGCSVTNADVAGGSKLVAAVTAAGANDVGITALLAAKKATGPATCVVASNGRGILTAPAPSGSVAGALTATGLATVAAAPRVFYLVGPDRGYFLETGYAAMGSFEPQAGAPFSGASLSGTYRFGTGAPSSGLSVGSSGVATANGSGSAVFTPDAGLTNQGLLATGASQTNAYALTDAVGGRFSLGSAVLYSLSPNRFVQIDLDPNAVSPSIGLMQR